MTEAVAPSLTPPTARKARAPKDPNAPKKERQPRKSYGYHENSTIAVVQGKEIKYRGHRLAWYESVKAMDGKTVKEWEATRKAEKDPPRGWLRFFVADGAVVLSSPEVAKAA